MDARCTQNVSEWNNVLRETTAYKENRVRKMKPSFQGVGQKLAKLKKKQGAGGWKTARKSSLSLKKNQNGGLPDKEEEIALGKKQKTALQKMTNLRRIWHGTALRHRSLCVGPGGVEKGVKMAAEERRWEPKNWGGTSDTSKSPA